MSTTSNDDRMTNISEVERETGIAKETLRVWERRYDFPKPGRDANGERIYTSEQRSRLQLIKRLIDNGYRPGKIVHLPGEELNELAQLAARKSALPPPDADDPMLAECMALITAHRVHELRQAMMQAQLRLGLRNFVTDLVAPLTTLVGDAWAAGRLAIFEEHLYAETLQSVMRAAIFTASQQTDREQAAPRILLTTVPIERHGLGLLMAEALFALEGASCISLGVQTPLSDIVTATKAHRADIVALSFSAGVSCRAAMDNISQLRERLDGAADVWVGGACAAQLMRQLGPECVLDLEGIAGAVQRWRSSRAALVN
ncbi:MerR family transcriptional regulator [Massilia sp. GCM10020059]|uniref:MerR family transcriptional regulator n=1 Tax=Massilia agrisoli TaxID=2892444 RepID=A0ABS8IMZ3_9BURK|nr:MerR family transcriptional regulator [Massilia agrisoli]MCC6069711.1 MerR family transcriptional regulator [Massilia agrisoli]